jgi:hypothetical protein
MSFFSLNFFCACSPFFWGEKASVGNRDTKHKTLWRARKKTARSSFALPPPLRARSLLLLLDFFSFALSLLLARVLGKVSGNKPEREREKGRPFVFQQLVFFLLLSLSSLLCFVPLSLLCSLSFSLSLSASVLLLLRCSRLVTKQQHLSLFSLFFPHSK